MKTATKALAVAGMMALSGAAFANEGPHTVDQKIQKLDQKLDLSAQQEAELRTIFQNTESQVRAVLNDQQKTKYDALKEDRGDKNPGSPSKTD